jgi:hypothetical protein
MTPPFNAALTATPYERLMDPGTLPIISPGATKAVREQLRTEHHEEQRVFDNHHNMDDALKAQVIDTVHDTYLCEMGNTYTGYLGVSQHATYLAISLIDTEKSHNTEKSHQPTSKNANAR